MEFIQKCLEVQLHLMIMTTVVIVIGFFGLIEYLEILKSDCEDDESD